MDKLILPGLYAITDGDLLPPARLVPAIESALKGGVVMVQYREKQLPFPERLSQARNLVAVCNNSQVPLIINDDPELARRAGASGVHLGQSDSSLAAARKSLGEAAIIGATCHASIGLAENAHRAGADYLAFGRFFASSTKPDAPAADTGILSQARMFNRPVTAIGGITLDNGGDLICAGADMLAVIGGLFDVADDLIEHRAWEFTRLFMTHHPLFKFPTSRS